MSKPVFKENLVWEGKNYSMELFDDNDFSKLNVDEITQVYGFIFNKNNEILIVKCNPNKDWSLPGGTPEKIDKTWQRTLIREVDEEADVEIEDIQPALYAKINTKDKDAKRKIGIALRVVAKVKNIKPQTIDPASGRINERKFVSVEDFLKYCPWKENGRIQLEIALRVFKSSNNKLKT